MELPIYQIDAFAGRVFAGNPAAVCPLESWLPDGAMQSIAAENNLSETAFFAGAAGKYAIRWFTPASEVDLCGHATLASAYVITNFLDRRRDRLEFTTRCAGGLAVERKGDLYILDFPARPPAPTAIPEGFARAVGAEPDEFYIAIKNMAVFSDADAVAALRPDFSYISRLEGDGLIVTAPGKNCDFVSRYFAPNFGIDEDPVTGSSHCTLAPYWARRLHKNKLYAMQVSRRGGELHCEVRDSRVLIGGRATLYLKGSIYI